MKKTLIDFLLNDLRPRPGMYLTAYSLSYLNIYLTGVQITCDHLTNGQQYLNDFFGQNGFLQWSWEKYSLGHPPYRLDHYLEFTNENEQEALNLFFDDLEEYYTKKNI